MRNGGITLILLALAAMTASCDKGNGDPPPRHPDAMAVEFLAPGQIAGPYSIQVPAGSVSLTIMADGANASDMDIIKVSGPSGESFIDGGSNDLIGRNFANGYGQSAVEMTIPHGGDYDFPPGVWTFWIRHTRSREPEPKEVGIYTDVKSAPGSRLNLNLFIIASGDVSAQAEPILNEVLARFQASMGLMNITVGAVEVIYLTSDEARKHIHVNMDTDFDNNGQPDDMDALFMMSANYKKGHINIFFVDSFGFQGILGIAGGAPGPQLVQGSANSGVAINTFGGFTSLQGKNINTVANTMAHEVGHYLGLLHTSERYGDTFDPIADTPECDVNVRDKDNDGMVSADECSALDGPNIMFWSSASFSQEEVSGTQKYVVSLNPAIK